MRLNKRKSRIVFKAIDEWQSEGVIGNIAADKLKGSVEVVPVDWKRVAWYSLILSVGCFVVAILNLVMSDLITSLIEKIVDSPALFKALSLSALGGAGFAFSVFRYRRKPEKHVTNDALSFLSCFMIVSSLAFYAEALGMTGGHFSILILVGTILLGFFGLAYRSKFNWLFSLISFGSWVGLESGYVSGWGAYFLGMSYPLRMAAVGLVIILVAHIFSRIDYLRTMERITGITGLLYLFIALWIMSIFGNYSFDVWRDISDSELLFWIIAFGAASILSIVYGFIADKGYYQKTGITFLIINIYTRYFENFWEMEYKVIFFLILGISFWLVGRYAEQIWNLKFLKR